LLRERRQASRDEFVATLVARAQPRLMVCGHIHPAYGRYRYGETAIINASLVDNRYRPVNPLVEIGL
jgi:Icc-related predicted phosphoesterase